jgi:hypothetical protein
MFCGKFSFAHHSYAIAIISTYFSHLAQIFSTTFHSGFFPDHLIIFIANLSHSTSQSISFQAIKTSDLKYGLSIITKPNHFLFLVQASFNS